ncbi:uncharacterized protein LOC103570117 [Microplitis demolitor]|uniref:uncharacterized protein LOC103570117 n=1 Tax=Microplitis demolitor TaxID=69319 RepID=UPI0004CCF98A|nr:uncharacterized protein LOC103570117 [Microplitis demolitor]
MPRRRIKKTHRGEVSTETYEAACKQIVENKQKIRCVAKIFNISYPTLRRYFIKFKNGDNLSAGYHPHNKVFSTAQENLFVNNCLSSAQLYYGLTTIDLRKLAYEFAVANQIKRPSSWDTNKQAGVDWTNDVMKRHPEISIRVPEATSLARGMNFNKPNVTKFFNNLQNVQERYNFTVENIWNLDECALTTSQKPVAIIAAKGIKQVGSIASHERGTLVTMCLAVSAIGNSVPPFFILPRKNFKNHFLNGGPTGCTGTANQSGWMQEGDFLKYLEHFVQHAKPSEKNRVLLVLDNHSAHISLAAINYCRDNFITMLSFPPQTSHKLQPLDRSVFGPFKRRFNSESDNWYRLHPGVRMTIYDIPKVAAAAMSSVTIDNITAGFKCTGIYPLNPDILSDKDFAPATVTDMPEPNRAVEHADQSVVQSIKNLASSQNNFKLNVLSPNDINNGILHDKTNRIQEAVILAPSWSFTQSYT